MKNMIFKELIQSVTTQPLNIIKTLIVSVLLFSTSSTVMAYIVLTDFSALTGEYVASNPGLEIAVPSWIKVDHDSDGITEGYDFHFDVYKLGTKTKLFSTPDQYLPYVLSACSKRSTSSKRIDFKRIGNNIVLSTRIFSSCDPYKELITGHIYAVNISAAGKTPWVKSFSGNLIGTGILPDKNGNGIGELSVVIETGFSDELKNADDSIYVYDGETGASLATPQKYAIER